MSSIWNPEEGSDFLHGSSLEDPLLTDPEIEDSTQLLLVLPPLCVCDKYTFKAGHVASLRPSILPSLRPLLSLSLSLSLSSTG